MYGPQNLHQLLAKASSQTFALHLPLFLSISTHFNHTSHSLIRSTHTHTCFPFILLTHAHTLTLSFSHLERSFFPPTISASTFAQLFLVLVKFIVCLSVRFECHAFIYYFFLLNTFISAPLSNEHSPLEYASGGSPNH